MTYVCYKNGFVDFIGTQYEVITHYGWKGGFKTFHWYQTPSAKKRGFCIERVV